MNSLHVWNTPLISPGQFRSRIGNQIIFLFIIILLLTSFSSIAWSEQPAEGPGSAEYFNDGIIKSSYGSGDSKYYIFEPDNPKPPMAPVVAFLHGLGGTRPETYGAWIKHLVKKGNIVIFPVYQSQSQVSLLFNKSATFTKYLSNSIQSVQGAIEVLQSGNHVEPDLNMFATVGHSLGGVIAVNVAALAEESGLPAAKAVMSVEPGRTFPLEDLSKISPEALLLTVVGDRDSIVGDKLAKDIFWGTSQIPLENKDFITLVSDQHRFWSISADHFAPTGRASIGGSISDTGRSLSMFGVNALDGYGLWKLFDALTDAAFYGENREYALGNTPQQRYMGEWSDGTPIRELIVTKNP